MAATPAWQLRQYGNKNNNDNNENVAHALHAYCMSAETTLLYGYSLIIAKNFVTVYTAFDY